MPYRENHPNSLTEKYLTGKSLCLKDLAEIIAKSLIPKDRLQGAKIQSFNNCLAITNRWISLVPSPIVHSFTSR